MRCTDGKPTVCDGAWISYLTAGEEDNFIISGELTAGYGSLWGASPGKRGEKIGPAFTFGLTMDARFDEPVYGNAARPMPAFIISAARRPLLEWAKPLLKPI